MSLLELYRDDLLNKYASHTFTETAVGDHWKITFKNAGSVVIAEVTKQGKEDAYKLIRENLEGTFAEKKPEITSTQRDALTSLAEGTPILQITDNQVEEYINGGWKVIGGTEWITRASQTVTTTDATETVIDSFTLGEGETYLVQANIVAQAASESGRGGAQKMAVVYRKTSESATMQGAVETVIARGSNGAWVLDIQVSGNDVQAIVQGVASTTITWKVSMQYIQH